MSIVEHRVGFMCAYVVAEKPSPHEARVEPRKRESESRRGVQRHSCVAVKSGAPRGASRRLCVGGAGQADAALRQCAAERIHHPG